MKSDTLSFVNFSQPLLVSQELFEVVICRELNLIVEVTIFSIDLAGPSIADFAGSVPCDEASGPLLDDSDCFGLNLELLSLLTLDLGFNADDARNNGGGNLGLKLGSIVSMDLVQDSSFLT